MVILNVVILVLQTVSVVSEKCRILAFEGGGSRGAYQAGIVYALANNLPSDEVAWNVISGVSTGSLNTIGCIQFPLGEEKAMSEFLVDTWKSLNGSSSAFVEWPYGLIAGLLFGPSLYDSSPLRQLLVSNWQAGVHRNFTIPTTDFNTGKLRVFDESLAAEFLPEAVMCSAAPPFYFPPQHFEGTVYVDGGCLVNLEVASPVNKCRASGFKDSEISVDMVFLTSNFLLPVTAEWTVSSVRKRVQDIQAFDYTMWFGYYAKQAFPNVDFRYTFVPSEEMPGGEIPLDFAKENIINEIELGQHDAMNVLTKGANGLRPLLEGRKTQVRAFYRQS